MDRIDTIRHRPIVREGEVKSTNDGQCKRTFKSSAERKLNDLDGNVDRK